MTTGSPPSYAAYLNRACWMARPEARALVTSAMDASRNSVRRKDKASPSVMPSL